MAALTLQSTANYEIHENVRVDTLDNEDHTFCGIMFPIQAKAELPVSRLVVRSVSVRGRLGLMTVWVTNDDDGGGGGGDDLAFVRCTSSSSSRSVSGTRNYSVTSLQRIRSNPAAWTKIYEMNHGPSPRKYQVLDFGKEHPIVLLPGQTKVIYIHSAAHHDLGIVYDNACSSRQVRYTDSFVNILSGAAHLSPRPFDNENIWGWGSAWREYREFVGQVDFGAVYQLWSPDLHNQFGSRFQQVTYTLLACQRRPESPVSMLPDECIYYILNMCRWDWFDDSAGEIEADRKRAGRKGQRAGTSEQALRAIVRSGRNCGRNTQTNQGDSGGQAQEVSAEASSSSSSSSSSISAPCRSNRRVAAAAGAARAAPMLINNREDASGRRRRIRLSFYAFGNVRSKILNALSRNNHPDDGAL